MRQLSIVNTIVAVTAVCFGSASAFLTLHPSLSRRSHLSSSHREHDNNCCRRSVRARVPTSGNAYAATATAAFNTIMGNRRLENSAAFLAMVQGVDADETPESPADSSVIIENAESKAAKLNAFAAELRAQARVLESELEKDRKQAAQETFDAFDTNDDGTVDVKELIAGLEGQLRKDFVKRMTKKMQRKPTPAEVDEKIAEMPGGALLPVELGKKLIEAYDTNGDGVLQPEEFATKDDLRLRLDNLFSERAQEERLREAEARVKEIEERGALKAREAAKARGLALPEDFNDAPPTEGDKILSALPYLLPLMDSLVYGAHIFSTYPEQLKIFEPLVAVLLIYRSLPFSGLILFFGLQYFASKPEVNKLVRFNCRQAVNIDIAMFFPSFAAWAVQLTLGEGVASKLAPLAASGSDAIFIAVILSILYSIVSSAFGVLPENLPFLGPLNREGSRFGEDDKGGDDDKS